MRRRGATVSVVTIGLAIMGAAGACTLLVPLDAQQCSSDGDCTGRGAAFEGTVCLNHVCAPPQPVGDADLPDTNVVDAGPDVDNGPWGCLDNEQQVPNPNAKVALNLQIFNALKPIQTKGPSGGSDLDTVSYTPVPGMSVVACNILDPGCKTPVSDVVISSDSGNVPLTVAGDFNGFFRITGKDYLPSALYPGNTLADASAGNYPTAMLATSDTLLLAAALGVDMQTDPEAGVGHAFFNVYDCFDRHGVGVQFKVGVDGGPDQVQWYTKNNVPSTSSTQTDSLGAGGVVNVPAGALTVVASLADGSRTLGTINAYITAGGTTFGWVRVRSH